MSVDNFERDLQAYSEIETRDESVVTPPKTLQQYHRRMQLNNTGSIFDSDYALNEPSNASFLTSTENVNGSPKNNLNNDLGVFKDEKVIYVISGRGRGGRNILVNPGASNRSKVFNDDDEIRRQIRKVAPIGYSNEITENAVRAHKLARTLASTNISPNISKPSSPVTSKAGSEPGNTNSSTSKTETNRNIDSPTFSEKSVPMCTTPNGITNSEDQCLSLSSSKSSLTEEKSDECQDVSIGASTNKTPSISETNKGAIPRRPVPLSVMLKQSRADHVKKQLEQKKVLTNGYSDQDYEDDLASQRKIEEILYQDHLEKKMGNKKHNVSNRTSSYSGNSRDNLMLSRYSLEQREWAREPKQLDINSMKDFPALKTKY